MQIPKPNNFAFLYIGLLIFCNSCMKYTCEDPLGIQGSCSQFAFLTAVNDAGEGSSSEDGVRVVYSPPTLNLVSPNDGILSGGTEITLSGTGFLNGATVSVGGNLCSGVEVLSSTSIQCTTPSNSAGYVDVVVTNPDGQSVSGENLYEYYGPCGYGEDNFTEIVGTELPNHSPDRDPNLDFPGWTRSWMLNSGILLPTPNTEWSIVDLFSNGEKWATNGDTGGNVAWTAKKWHQNAVDKVRFFVNVDNPADTSEAGLIFNVNESTGEFLDVRFVGTGNSVWVERWTGPGGYSVVTNWFGQVRYQWWVVEMDGDDYSIWARNSLTGWESDPPSYTFSTDITHTNEHGLSSAGGMFNYYCIEPIDY